MNTSNTNTWNGLPPQKVSAKTKYSKEHQKKTIDSIIGMAGTVEGDGRSTKQNKQINYDIVNSKYKESDFHHVLYPYGVDTSKFSGSPTKMQGYNYIRQKLESLKGEEMKMGLNFRAVAVNGEAVNSKNEERAKATTEAIKARAMAIINGDVDESGQPKAEDPAKVAAGFRTEYSNPTEIEMNKLLKYLVMNDLLQMKFSKGWEHALISAEEIYYLSVLRGHPSLRVCNPLNVYFDRESDSPFIHKSDWAMEERWMPKGAVIDTYGEYLSDELVDRLDKGELGGAFGANNGMQPGFAYDFNGGMRLDHGYSENTSHVYVANCSWRSWKKIGHLRYLDPRTGKIEATTVDETFKLTPELKEQGAQLTWDWITEIWEGTRIGHNDYINVRPLENQTGNLPYIGYIYNNVNSVATSIVDMVKAHQYTIIIVWWRLEQELAKAKGKKFVMDLAQLPKSKGWTVDQWMYYFDNLGVAWINSHEEGRKGDPSSTSKFNQFTGIDMSLSNVVGQYMSILDKLEQQIESITGVSRQRAGDIGSSETATGAQRAIIQSTNNTKPLFYYHDLVRQTVLQEILELCKIAYIDGVELEFAVDEHTIESIKMDSQMINGTDLGVFMTNSFEEMETLEKLEQYLEVALQTDKAKLSDIVSVLGSKSVSLVRDTLVAGERDKEARDAAAQQQASADLDKQIQATAQEKELEREFQRELKQMELDNKVEVALIKENSKIEDLDNDGINDNSPQELRKIALEERKQSHVEKVKERELKLKEKDLEEKIRSNKKKESQNSSKNATNR